MNSFRPLLAALLAAAVFSLSGCTPRTPASRPEPDKLTDNESQEQQPSGQGDPTSDRDNPSNSEDEKNGDSLSEEDSEESPDSEDEDGEEEEEDTGQSAPKTAVYKLMDSGYQITVKPPLRAQRDPNMDNLTFTADGENMPLGYLYYDTSEEGFKQLESTVKTMSDAIQEDPTVTNFEQKVDEGTNGQFSFTFTYSAGATEGSPAGFYYVHYQKTASGVLTASFTCPKVNYTNDILALFDSIVPVTGEAVAVPTAS